MPELLDIVGQDEAIGRLEGVLGSQRRPHSFMFTGPEGVGRRTAAIALARTLLCESPRLVPNHNRFATMPADFTLRQACGHCPDCRMVDASSHPDFSLIYKELAAYHEDANVRDRVMQELSIEVIRSFLIAPAGRRATRGRGKVFIVREAELMSVAAQNALLKTLEEPPAGVTIILLCQRSEEMLPTTVSRCSLIRFGLLPREFVTRKLQEQQVPAPEAEFWAAFTEGSIGRSSRLAQAGMYKVKRGVVEHLADMNRAGDAQLGEDLFKTTEKLADELAKSVKTESTEMSKSLAVRQTAGAMLELIAGAFRDALSLRSGCDRPLINADQRPQVEALAGKFEPIELAGIIEQLSQLEQLLWRNVNPKTIWDNVVITCASAAPLNA